MRNSHPYRYPAAFRAQLGRLERLSPGITIRGAAASPSPSLLEIEHRGATIDDIRDRNLRLRHLESLIADWYIDGETASLMPLDDLGGGSPATVEFSEVPASVTYIEFDSAAELDLEFQPRSRLEGFYVREIVSDGKFCAEITFVCDEPAWKAMGTCVYADAMEVGARISIGVIPLHEEIRLTTASRLFDGDPALSEEPAILRAIAMASELLHAVPRISSAPRGPMRQTS